MRTKPSEDTAAALTAFFSTGKFLLSAKLIADRTNRSIGEVNRALIEFHRMGVVRTDPEAKLWTNIFPKMNQDVPRSVQNSQLVTAD